MALPEDSAERHRSVAGTFTDRARGVCEWDAPSPVAAWRVRDVVRHLLDWFPPFLAGGSPHTLPSGPGVDDDPVAAWHAQAAAVQELLDDPGVSGSPFAHERVPAQSLGAAIDRFYTADVFMHTWDLARGSGQADHLDPDFCAVLLGGMEQMEDVIRGSGQFGARVPVPHDAGVQDRLLGFIGRDPWWSAR